MTPVNLPFTAQDFPCLQNLECLATFDGNLLHHEGSQAGTTSLTSQGLPRNIDGHEKALERIAENKRTRSPFLDLGNLGLPEVPEEMFEHRPNPNHPIKSYKS